MSYFVIKLVATGNELYEKAFLTVLLIGLGFALFNLGWQLGASLSRLCWTFEKISQLLRFPSKCDRPTVQRRTPAKQ